MHVSVVARSFHIFFDFTVLLHGERIREYDKNSSRGRCAPARCAAGVACRRHTCKGQSCVGWPVARTGLHETPRKFFDCVAQYAISCPRKGPIWCGTRRNAELGRFTLAMGSGLLPVGALDGRSHRFRAAFEMRVTEIPDSVSIALLSTPSGVHSTADCIHMVTT